MTTIASFYKIEKKSLGLLFKELELNNIEVIDLSNGKPSLKKSCKPLFFPSTEKILDFKIADKGVTNITTPDSVEVEIKKRFIFGANICDAYAPNILDAVFSQAPADKFYMNKRKSTVMAAILCDSKDVACFCDQVIPMGKYFEAADLIFTELDADSWAVRSNNARSEELFGPSFSHFIEDNTLGELFTKKQEKLFASKNPEGTYQFPKVEELKSFIEKSFDSELFDSASMNCIGCATCTYSCPTCHCFDIVDEKTYYSGERRKNWDSCAFSLFTLHASGHNPRDHQGQRWRQRLLHKFSVYKERFNQIACVGCGRCVRLCPAGVNMLEMFEKWKISIDHS